LVFEDRLKAGDDSVLSLGFIASGGGVPIVLDGKMIGAIGVSGAPTSAGDVGPAHAGANAIK
jgi:uncharacterized protein GlcG (DUF336 family)